MQVNLTEPAVKRLIELLEKTGDKYDQRIAKTLKDALTDWRPAVSAFDLDEIPF